MGVVFIPNIAWQVVEEPEWATDSWGIATAELTYRGPRPKKTAAENSLVYFGAMPGFSAMRLMGYRSANTTASFPSIKATYTGFRNGVPPAKGTPGVAAATARVQGTDTATGQKVSATIAYRASRTTWEWWETSTPTTNPRYNTCLIKIDPRTNYDYIQFETEDGKTTVPLSTFTAIINAARVEEVVTDYQPEPIVPGAIWRCSSVIDYKIIST